MPEDRTDRETEGIIKCLMGTCWAEHLGNCCDKMSREHLLTKSLFSGGIVDVHGFPWCKEKPARIGVSSLTAKILCKRHNSDLSPIDGAGLQAFETFQESTRLASVRKQMKHRIWTIKEYRLQGKPFELWCLKTLINVCCDRGHAIGRDSVIDGRPSDRLVRIAYGLASFQGRSGLYWVTRVGMTIRSEDVVQFAPMFKNNLNVEAGIFTFRGLMMLLFLEEEGPPQPLTGIVMNDVHLGDAELFFHLSAINMNVGKYISHRVVFDW